MHLNLVIGRLKAQVFYGCNLELILIFAVLQKASAKS